MATVHSFAELRSMNHSYGLGLAIAESIALAHGGKIWAEMTNGINTFYVKLPVKKNRHAVPVIRINERTKLNNKANPTE